MIQTANQGKMAKITKVLKIFIIMLLFLGAKSSWGAVSQSLLVRVYHLPYCKACIKVAHDIIPKARDKYGDQVRWEFINVQEKEEYARFLQLENKFGRKISAPAVLVSDEILVGITQIADRLDQTIEVALKEKPFAFTLEGEGVNLLERFNSFGAWAVLGAGLVDGVNPCAFTVIVFFISFLTLMGYGRREMAWIGSCYILAVFLTYLALGLGFFKILYAFKGFYLVSRLTYLLIGTLSFFCGVLALKDYLIYQSTGRTDQMSLQLPKAIKNRIHKIVGDYYRKGPSQRTRAILGLSLSALTVGFLVSLLEAVCTGQLYLPTIVYVLKEGSLRGRAFLFLIGYNLMFILPLVAVFALALGGASSQKFEDYARKNMGRIKVLMALVFFTLAVVLWVGI